MAPVDVSLYYLIFTALDTVQRLDCASQFRKLIDSAVGI